MLGQQPRGGLAHLANAQRKDEARHVDGALRLNGAHQVVDGLVLPPLASVQPFRRQAKNVAGGFDQAVVEEADDVLAAQPFDVEGIARDEMLQAFVRLGRTHQAAGAARRSFVFFPHRMAAAHRARGGKFKTRTVGMMAVVDHFDDLRNNVARALDAHMVADPDVLFQNIIGVVQGGTTDHHAADRDRFQLGHRRQHPGAAHLNGDGVENGLGFFGGELVSDGPARRARHEAQTVLPIQSIDLVDHAVDIVIQARAGGTNVLKVGHDIGHRRAYLGQRIDDEAPGFETIEKRSVRFPIHGAHRTPGIGEELKRALGGDGAVQLAQRSGGGVARVGERLITRRDLTFIESQKISFGHIDFAAHFQ